jgi:hypothetical protein
VLFCGVQGVHRGGGGGQVVIEQAGQRRPPVQLSVIVASPLSGVAAKQVMHAELAHPGRVNQVRAGRQVQQSAGRAGGRAGQGGGGVEVKVGAGVQAEEPERPGRLGV